MVYRSPTRGRVLLILHTQAGTIFCVSFFVHGRPPTVNSIIVGIRRKGQGHTKELINLVDLIMMTVYSVYTGVDFISKCHASVKKKATFIML